MKVDFNTRVINRGITRTAQSLQTPNDRLGRLLLKKEPNSKVDVKEILQNEQLMDMARDFYNKFIK